MTIKTLEHTPATAEKLTEIPDPVSSMDAKESEIYWQVCTLLLDRNNLSGKSATHARVIAEDIANTQQPGYFRPWERERSGEWVKLLAKRLNLSLDKLEEIERRIHMEAIARQCAEVELTIQDLKESGIKI